ncbi:MAG: selenocysteine-specific translation elongation factor [Thermoanaerobacterales bacterium]|nr:selenocysteine-specific translation elongation factor [Thermoanaerobacterales bacterium]
MSNIILGTAGHIDHGKTTLIKALTGVNTDRLKEEQKRGITIDLGFTRLILPSGKKVGIVDVPGHEKFIKNMLAGAGGIDIVILIIAADEGVMPQTEEHLNILKLLDVKKGLTVLTKIDMVDKEWLDLVKEDVKERIKGTFLENAPIIPVSSVTGEGVEVLLKAIDEMCEEEIYKDIDSPFRLPVDRVFTLQGIGTVVTGSLLCGKVKTGDDVQIFPKGIFSRIRSIEVHDEIKHFAESGQRTALNLADVKTEDIERGDVVAHVGALLPVSRAYANFKLLDDTAAICKNRARVRIHLGTKEVLARIVLLDKNEIKPGDQSFIEINFEEPVTCAYKDRFVVRRYSPLTTIGGGQIFYVNPKRIHKGKKLAKAVLSLTEVRDGGLEEFVLNLFAFLGREYMTVNEICPYTGKHPAQIDKVIQSLLGKDKIVPIKVGGEDAVIEKSIYFTITERALAVLEDYHKKFPLREGMAKGELINRIGHNPKLLESLLGLWHNQNIIKSTGNTIKKAGFNVILNHEQKDLANKILQLYKEKKWAPPNLQEVVQIFDEDVKSQARFVLYRLCDEGRLVKINEEIFIAGEWLDEAKQRLRCFFSENRELTASEFREMLETTRKYAIPILEYFDGIKVTKRIRDKRVPGPSLNS